jgi:probable phosphoglycerate mutase
MTDRPQPHRVVLVRHGATDWSEQGRHTGWTDLPLNQRGIEQARTLAGALSRWSFSAVLCSPLQRARTTCELAGFIDRAEIDPDLREWRYGDDEGLTSAEIREQRPGWTIWDDGVLNGESLDQVAARADHVVGALRELTGDVAVFAHGHLLRVLAARWMGRPPRLAQHLRLSTATISEVGWEHDWPTINLWNDGDHLRALR